MQHVAAMETGDRPATVFHRIALQSGPRLGCSLFTVTRHDAANMQVERVYSSNPAVYPVGGRKPKRDTAWGRQVLLEGKPLVCTGDEAITRMFDDHATILGLGLHSCINVPVLSDAACVGVLNFLMTGGTVSPQQLRDACDFAVQPALVAALAGFPRCPPDLIGAT